MLCQTIKCDLSYEIGVDRLLRDSLTMVGCDTRQDPAKSDLTLKYSAEYFSQSDLFSSDLIHSLVLYSLPQPRQQRLSNSTLSGLRGFRHLPDCDSSQVSSMSLRRVSKS